MHVRSPGSGEEERRGAWERLVSLGEESREEAEVFYERGDGRGRGGGGRGREGGPLGGEGRWQRVERT